MGELRYKMLFQSDPAEADRLNEIGQQNILRRYTEYEQMAGRPAEMFHADARRES